MHITNNKHIHFGTLSKRTILLVELLFVITCFGQTHDKYEAFKKSDYPATKYQIKNKTSTFSKFKIEIRQAKRIGNITNAPSDFYCRSWLKISQGNRINQQIYFKYIEPVGGCSGLFIPDKQPRKDYFIISKFGDYDGSIFIVDTLGKVTEKIGGIFYISQDKRYLFSSYDSDLSGLTVYDLNKKHTLFSDTIEPYLSDWYFQDKKYFAIVNEDVIQNNKIKIATFDFTLNRLTISLAHKNYPKKENKLKVYNDYQNAKDCNCGN